MVKAFVERVSTLRTPILCMFIVVLSSFSGRDDEEFIGTYGVSETDPSRIELTLNTDHTFLFEDHSNPENKINVNGEWMAKGNKVILSGNNSTVKFHDTWTFTEQGQVAKSRKGLTFYRLCKTKN